MHFVFSNLLLDNGNNTQTYKLSHRGAIAGAIVGVVGLGVGVTLEDAKFLILSPALGIVIAAAGLMLEAPSFRSV